MERLVLVPDAQGYSVTPAQTYLRQGLPGGPGRYRQDQLYGADLFTCTWTVGPEDYNYLRSFYREYERLQESFLVQLSFNYAELEDYSARILPDSWRLTGQQGLQYTVSAEIEAEPAVRPDPAGDSFFIGLRAINSEAWNSLLDLTVNQELPPQISMDYRADLDYVVTTLMPES